MIYREMSISVNGNAIASDDAQKRKQIQQQLILIFHACRCQKHFEINGMIPCSSPHCAMMRDVLSHMSVCNKEKQCPFSHCSTSKRILSHWKKCGKITCLICAPIKSRQQCNKNKTSIDSVDHEIKDGIINNPDINVINNQDKKSSDFKADVNENKMKDWKMVDKNIRSRLINRIVETILPVKDCGKAYKDERMINIIDHAKKIENDSYMKSSTIDEYYRLLAENCFIIHKKLCISQKNCVSCPEIISKSPNISIDNSTNNNNDSDLFLNSNKGCSDADHLNHFEKILQNEYERQRKLLMNFDVKEEIKTENKVVKEVKKEVKQEPQSVVTDVIISKEESPVKIWPKDELLIEFKVLFDFIKSNKNVQIFLSLMDTKNSNSIDASKINPKPINLSTISQKLEDGEYDNPWIVVDDFNVLIKNVCNYSKKKGKSKKEFVQSMSDIQTQIDEIMVKLGFCCGRAEVYQPLTLLCCTANVCTINKDSVYYAYQNENSDDKVPGMVVDSYLCCEKCYSDSSAKVSFIAESNELLTVKKELLVKKRNNVEIHEEFVFCVRCNRKWHKVCACHIDEIWSTFYCKNCTVFTPKRENKYTAKRLASCTLSNFLEKRVNDYLKKNEITAENVIIRVLSSVKKVTEVKPGMKSYYGNSDTVFPYRSKAIFAFQECQGREVCFFGLHVQEYGSDCPEPNKRRVYVAYLDSVKFFEPSKHRTKVYYEILVGYLDYVKKLGYAMAHIWACPPSEGDDYIFHIHPPDQRIPKPKRLQEWYTKMLDKGIQELVIDDYKDVYKDATLSDIKSVTDIPYFEGDFWPNAFEDILKEFEENNRKAKEIASIPDDFDESESIDAYEISKDNGNNSIGNKKPKKRKQKKTTNITTSKRKKFCDQNVNDIGSELFKKVMEIMEKHKDNFFIIRLNPVKNLKEIVDPDQSIESELMDGRENFLQMARSKHLEFSNLRRSLYSTLVMCYELHNEVKQSFCYTCNACTAQIETRYHCSVCEEFDLCHKCYTIEKHAHPLEKISSGVDDESSDNSNFKSDENCEETNRRRIDRLVKDFGHSATCRDACCRRANCKTFKVMLFHNKNCKDGVKCSQCKYILKLSAYHAKFCTDVKCMVVYCQQIKLKLKKQENKQRYVQSQILRRRTALMRCNSNVSNNNPSSVSAQEMGNNSVNNCSIPTGPAATVVQNQYQFLQNSNNVTNSNNNNNLANNNLEFTSVKINTPTSNQSFNMKSNYIHPANQNMPMSINSPHISDIPNYQCGIYPNGNYPPINKQKDMMVVESMYNTYSNQPDGNLKFNEWLKNNPAYLSAYRHMMSRQPCKPPMMSPHPGVYPSAPVPGPPQSQTSMLHQRMHNASIAQQSQLQSYYVNNGASMALSLSQGQPIGGGQSYLSAELGPGGNHIVTGPPLPPGNKSSLPPGLVSAGQMSLPPINRIPHQPMPPSPHHHPMNNYSQTLGAQFIMSNMGGGGGGPGAGYIQSNHHQSSPGTLRPASAANAANVAGYSQISQNGGTPGVGVGVNVGSQQVFSKMMVPQKAGGAGLPQQNSINFQSPNPNDSQLYRSNHQNYFN